MFFNSSIEKYEILNRNHLKYLAIIFMIIDHISFFYDPTNPIIIACGFISRTTAPIMALFIAEGYHYTRDVKKYMKRLFIFAINVLDKRYKRTIYEMRIYFQVYRYTMQKITVLKLFPLQITQNS